MPEFEFVEDVMMVGVVLEARVATELDTFERHEGITISFNV